MRHPARRDFGGEPSLDELLADPILHQLLDRDGLDEHALLEMMAEARARLSPEAEHDGEPALDDPVSGFDGS